MSLTPQKSNRHSRTRQDHATEVAEDYVEAIAEVTRATGTCRARDLAQHFGVSHVTVSKTIGRLQRDGFVRTKPYGPIFLTETGEELARASRERHEIVYRFLRALGVSETTAGVDAEGMEHHVSPETLQIMRRFADGASGER